MRYYVIIVATYWQISTLLHSFRHEGNWNFQNRVYVNFELKQEMNTQPFLK